MIQQPSFLDVNPSARRDADFYPTPAYMTRALEKRIFLAKQRVLEPCAGDGAIARVLEPYCGELVTNDIVQRDPLVPDFLLDARHAASWRAFAARRPIDVTVTNPPFEAAFDIAAAAHNHSAIGMALLLRLSWLEPTEERGRWLQQHPPALVIVMPRHDFRGNGQTDSVTSAWMVWERTPNSGFLLYHGIDVVTREERDALIAAETRGSRR